MAVIKFRTFVFIGLDFGKNTGFRRFIALTGLLRFPCTGCQHIQLCSDVFRGLMGLGWFRGVLFSGHSISHEASDGIFVSSQTFCQPRAYSNSDESILNPTDPKT